MARVHLERGRTGARGRHVIPGEGLLVKDKEVVEGALRVGAPEEVDLVGSDVPHQTVRVPLSGPVRGFFYLENVILNFHFLLLLGFSRISNLVHILQTEIPFRVLPSKDEHIAMLLPIDPCVPVPPANRVF